MVASGMTLLLVSAGCCCKRSIIIQDIKYRAGTAGAAITNRLSHASSSANVLLLSVVALYETAIGCRVELFTEFLTPAGHYYNSHDMFCSPVRESQPFSRVVVQCANIEYSCTSGIFAHITA